MCWRMSSDIFGNQIILEKEEKSGEREGSFRKGMQMRTQ